MGQVVVLDPAFTVQVMAMVFLTLDSREIKVITKIRVVTTSRVIRGGGQQQQQSGYQSNLKQLNSGQYHVFTTSLCKRDHKLHKRAVKAIEPAVLRYLRWSEQPIVWSREDHLPRVDNPGHLALVVAPQVGGYKFTKVLMDGGTNINILYYETSRRMSLTHKDLKPSNTFFHGVVPGKSAYPVGKIKIPYHTLFGRPAYAKFMARPCYVYLQLKMSGYKGTITVHGNQKIALECEEAMLLMLSLFVQQKS